MGLMTDIRIKKIASESTKYFLNTYKLTIHITPQTEKYIYN